VHAAKDFGKLDGHSQWQSFAKYFFHIVMLNKSERV